MDEKTLSNLNSLSAYLREFNVVELVRAHFAKYGNDAPPQLLEPKVAFFEQFVQGEYDKKKG